MIKRFSDFKNIQYNPISLNENISSAKTYIRNLYLKKKYGDKEGAKLTPDEERMAEKDQNFQRIKEMLKDTPNYVYLFTKIFFEDLKDLDNDNDKFRELETLKSSLEALKPYLNNLPQDVVKYVSKDANEKEKEASEKEGRPYRSPLERLSDDLVRLKDGKKMNDWLNNLPSSKKSLFKDLPDKQRERLKSIASAFYELDKNVQESLFLKIARYNSVSEIMTAAEDLIKSSSNVSYTNIMNEVNKINKRFGEANGAVEVFYKNNVLVLEIRSFQANKILNSHTAHCIKDSQGMWDNYVGDEKFNKQYYVYNLNLSPSDDQSVFGITVNERNIFQTAHDKKDHHYDESRMKSVLSSFGVPSNVIVGMTQKEVEERKRRINANKKLCQPGISLNDMKIAISDGGEPNAKNGKPLENALNEKNIEKVKYLLSVGANPNINDNVLRAHDINTIIILVKEGKADLSIKEVSEGLFNKFNSNIRDMEILLQNGLDPNGKEGLPLRFACRNGNIELAELLVKYGANLTSIKANPILFAIDRGHFDLVDVMVNKLKSVRDLNPLNSGNRITDDLKNKIDRWLTTSDEMSDVNKEKIRKMFDIV